MKLNRNIGNIPPLLLGEGRGEVIFRQEENDPHFVSPCKGERYENRKRIDKYELQ